MDADLAKALMSIGTVKGVEIGAGFKVAEMTGSQANDPMTPDGFLSNHAGGILAGITTGQDIVLRVAAKPIPSIAKVQQTIDVRGNRVELSLKGRHDVSAIPRDNSCVRGDGDNCAGGSFIEAKGDLMKTKIGVIGGTRGMGYWFARFLEKEGHAVRVCGRNMSEADIAEMADTCQVVVVSVPMGATGNVIAKVGPHMRAASLLMDLTSLKRDSVKSMLETSASAVIGCHPLFGPRVDSITGQHVVLCPARAGKWLSWLTDIFERNGALVVETTPEKHDQMMAIVQGLNHFNTIMMGLILSEAGVNLSELMKFSTPVFREKMEIMEKSVLSKFRALCRHLNNES